MTMKRTCVVAFSFAGLLLCCPIVKAGDAGEAAAVTFEYRNGTIKPEFIDWVAKFGARAAVRYDPNATISDYVKMLCNDTASANIQLFKQSLADQNIVVKGDDRVEKPKDELLLLPPCLPIPASATVARVVLPGERFWDYYTQSGTAPGFKVSSIDSLSPHNIIVDETPEAGKASTGLNEAIERVARRYLEAPASPADQPGELALKGFLAANELKLEGVTDQEIRKTVFDSIETIAPQSSSPQLKAGIEAAMKRWSGPNQLSSDSWIKILASSNADTALDFSKQVTWFDPSPSPKKDPAALQPGDIVVVPTTPVQSVQIPVDYALLSKANSAEAADFLKKNPPPSPTTQASEEQTGVALLDTQPIEDVNTGACDTASYKLWGTPAFAREFAAAAMRTRMLAYRKGVRKFSASVVVIDSGFVLAKEAGAFSDDAFTQVAELLHEQNAPQELGSKRVHGTIVAGLALGGPDLWGMPSALGLDVRITPATIFDVRMQNGVPTPTFKKQWLMNAVGTAGDIFNISFATRDEDQMRAFGEYIGKASSKLFVVAAGNNNLNSDVKGVDINDTQLYPQRFGGNERGPNLITVAAYDGKGLAQFSNFSESFVSIAAPGCAVTSWAPSDDNSEYVPRRVTGTSFSTPIVAHVAAVVKALMPPQFAEPRYVRARILAGADLIRDLKGVEDGRLLNPIKTVSLYEDVVEVETNGVRRLLTGLLQTNVAINDLCQGVGMPDGDVHLLKFARDPTPADGKDSVAYFMRDGILDNTRTCKHKAGQLAFTASTGEDAVINLDEVVDMVLKVPQNE